MEYSTTDKGEKKLEISDETITEFPEIKDIDILVCDGFV